MGYLEDLEIISPIKDITHDQCIKIDRDGQEIEVHIVHSLQPRNNQANKYFLDLLLIERNPLQVIDLLQVSVCDHGIATQFMKKTIDAGISIYSLNTDYKLFHNLEPQEKVQISYLDEDQQPPLTDGQKYALFRVDEVQHVRKMMFKPSWVLVQKTTGNTETTIKRFYYLKKSILNYF